MKTTLTAIVAAVILAACGDSGSTTASTPVAVAPPAPAALSASVLSVLNIEVLEQVGRNWTYSWRVRVSANGVGDCFLRTKYLDGGGTELYEGIEQIRVAPGAATYTGQDLVSADLAPRVRNMNARISSCFS